MRHGILQLELYYPHSGISTSLLLAWIGLELLDSRDNVIFFGLSGLGIIQNKSWLLKSHVAHAQCVKCLNVHWWGIQLFDNSIPQEISMFTQSIMTKLILMFHTLFVCIQSANSSGNILSIVSIAFGSLLNCISWPWVCYRLIALAARIPKS